MSANRARAGFSVFPAKFYLAPADKVAPLLLGHFLIRQTPQGPCGGAIVEVEAYLADDPACHAFKGPTPRNRSMFEGPGRAYVYLIYGMHDCINAVCRPPGHGEAVLIRAVEPLWGRAWMEERRKGMPSREWTNGPAKLCAALGIDREFDGMDLCDAQSPVFIARNPQRQGFMRTHGPMVTATRIGITRAAERPLRFYVRSHPGLSRPHRGEKSS